MWKVMLLLALLLQAIGAASAPAGAQEAQSAAAYGLPEATEDGVIFHAWNWSFDAIRQNLPAIAAAGFKSVQTSPIQGTKEPSMEGSKWWVLYQPINFSIGNPQLGDREAFRRLCEEAEQYGIHIIVDVVANHTGNAGGGHLTYQPAANVDPAIRNNPSFWHEARGVDDWDNRWQVTQWGIGLPDLNTSNQELQNMIIAFLNDAVSLGADGFRFDAAKHIELPGENGGSNFWPRVLGALHNKEQLYIYGEVLQGGADNFAGYADYMSVTPSGYGHQVRHAVGFGSGKNVHAAQHYGVGVSPSKLVTWVESHDTYANAEEESTHMNQWHTEMGWALVAARAETTSLYFNRPAGSGKFGSNLGAPGNDWWKDPDVAAVNRFKNAMVGEPEYLRTQGNEIMLIERGTRGMTIVNLGGQAQINSATNLASGTYANQASGGGTFTVANGRITGSLGSGQIAVLYEAETAAPTIAIDKNEGAFYTDVLPVKMTVANASSAAYALNGAAPVPFQSGDTVNIGAGAAFGTTFTLTIQAFGEAGQSATRTYTFVKQDPNAALTVHFYKPSGWGTPNMYYYDDSATPTRIGSAWPGTPMQSIGDGWYRLQVPGWTAAKVLFNWNGSQLPGASQPGYAVSGEKWIKDGQIYASNPDRTVPTITIDRPEGPFAGDSLSVAIQVQDADSAAYSLNGAAPVAFASGQTVTFGAGDPGGTSYTLTVTASNAEGTATASYSFVKQGAAQGITVHYYKPSAWGTPNIYYYDDSVTPTRIGSAWPGVPMQSIGDGWYSYTIEGWDQAYVIFNSNNQQTPGSGQRGYLVNDTAWIKDGAVTGEKPADGLIPVTFTVHNASTAMGQSVYIAGNIAELGSWNTANAAGPGSSANYPTWTVTVRLPAGASIAFKAIKKNASNQVVWESGADRTYTVSAGNPNVTFDFRN